MMRETLVVAGLLVLTALAGCASDGREPVDDVPDVEAFDDVVVIAVLDWQLDPYHYDFLASEMPIHQDDDPTNDLPLDRPPHEWLPGFPEPSTFDSYEGLELTLPQGPDDVPADLHDADADAWADGTRSGNGEVHYQWIPGTKAVGFLNYGGASDDGFASSSHGIGSASVSVGNIHGACPDCLLVFVNIPASEGEAWVREQSWIDASTHSYEGSTTGVMRDNISDCETDRSQAAVERGQQIFWAAGNGLLNTFTAPQINLVNCDKAPDWIVTVGAIDPDSGESFTGHAKPVNVASVGIRYPSAGGGSVTADATFSGTSNATPVTAGMYGEALWRLRRMVADDARVQGDGVIINGSVPCGSAQPDCAMADGQLTVHELREALYRAATPTDAYFAAGITSISVPVGNDETEVFTEGHGSFFSRTGAWEDEVQAIVDHATGAAHEDVPGHLREYMAAYSWCSQEVWGAWDHGYWRAGDLLPAPDPTRPFTTWLATICPETVEAIMAVAGSGLLAAVPSDGRHDVAVMQRT